MTEMRFSLEAERIAPVLRALYRAAGTRNVGIAVRLSGRPCTVAVAANVEPEVLQGIVDDAAAG